MEHKAILFSHSDYFSDVEFLGVFLMFYQNNTWYDELSTLTQVEKHIQM